jgi:hypothetical protein
MAALTRKTATTKGGLRSPFAVPTTRASGRRWTGCPSSDESADAKGMRMGMGMGMMKHHHHHHMRET